ncbi:class I SAM-dependent methyltransferase [bacterium]|nr:class I SAM-dependent methyltransferase [Actinomycetota bacterium]NDG31178.1 class I SAM-dependent methyltransferase [bacterium]
MKEYLPYVFIFLVVTGLWLLKEVYSRDREMFDNQKEGSKNTDKREDYEEIYDDFYASVYDKLFSIPERISFEKASIREYALMEWPKKEVKLLDACCGTAPLADFYCREGIDFVGLDSSEAMLKKARGKCSSGRFYKGDVTRVETFPPKSFSHVTMLYFSIYQFRNPKMILDNIYSWLKPGGILVLHLVDPNKFDPILDAASPFLAFSVQKYSTERVIDSDIFFDKFKYKSRFIKDPDDDEARFEEVFEFPNDYREHIHRLYMPTVSNMLDIVRSSGFTRHEMVDMTPVGYEYQYLVYFSK